MAVHGYSRLIAQMENVDGHTLFITEVETYFIVNVMEGYCKRESVPAMKENVFKTASGKYLLEQMFEKSFPN